MNGKYLCEQCKVEMVKQKRKDSFGTRYSAPVSSSSPMSTTTTLAPWETRKKEGMPKKLMRIDVYECPKCKITKQFLVTEGFVKKL